MDVGITEAARLTKKNKSVIWRDTKNGIITATQNGKGHRVYNIAELERVYGRVYSEDELATPETESREVASNDVQPIVEQAKLAVKLEYLERELNLIKDQLSEIKSDRDHWRNTAETALRALPAPTATPIETANNNTHAVIEPDHKPSFWQRLTGSKS